MTRRGTASEAATSKSRAHKSVGPAVVIGTALEMFDFYLYASMAALVLGPIFFLRSTPRRGLSLPLQHLRSVFWRGRLVVCSSACWVTR